MRLCGLIVGLSVVVCWLGLSVQAAYDDVGQHELLAQTAVAIDEAVGPVDVYTRVTSQYKCDTRFFGLDWSPVSQPWRRVKGIEVYILSRNSLLESQMKRHALSTAWTVMPIVFDNIVEAQSVRVNLLVVERDVYGHLRPYCIGYVELTREEFSKINREAFDPDGLSEIGTFVWSKDEPQYVGDKVLIPECPPLDTE